jgi:hypothetical protein
VVRAPVANEVNLCASYVSMKVSFQIEGHIVVHTGELHPSRDLSGAGVVQFAFQ